MGAVQALTGHNNPPGPIESASTTIAALAEFMKETPVIDGDEPARQAKLLCDRAKLALEDIESERDGLVRPLNTQVADINARYKAFHNTDAKKPGSFDRILNELRARLQSYLIKQEQLRRRAAEEAARKADDAKRIALEAEAKEREVLANAAAGECDIDVAQVTQSADVAFSEFELASRLAARADREARVRVGGGIGKASSLRTTEVLHLDSYNLAIKAIGPHPKIEEAILSVAREYRKQHGRLPAGVSATQERKL